MYHITGYRFTKGDVGSKGQAGTFYNIHPQGRGEQMFELSFNNVLFIPYDIAVVFEGLPAESVLYQYPESRKYCEDCEELASPDLCSGEVIDIAVALYAKDRGYDAIIYEDLEIQDLTTISYNELLFHLEGG